jgi:hypothetical protein
MQGVREDGKLARHHRERHAEVPSGVAQGPAVHIRRGDDRIRAHFGDAPADPMTGAEEQKREQNDAEQMVEENVGKS